MTITPKEYTKHYYANGERLATSIGAGGWCHVSPDVITEAETYHEMYLQKEWINSYIDKEYPFEYPQEDRPILTENEDISGNAYDEIQYVCPNRRLAQLKVDYSPDILWTVMHDNCDVQSAEDDIFYRHSDHLGSASWITEHHGDAIQYLHYMPYGQLLVNQMPYGYDERYKFTGKERDAETGYDYFGARFYAPSLLHWTTVDPLSDKYPGISPYAYCSWNPIKYIDPDGRWSVSVRGNSNRTKYPYALYQTIDNNGNVIFQTIVKVLGTKRDRKKEYADTPFGNYKQNRWRNDSKFGRNDFIDQTYISGEGRGINTDNRDRMHTHGGGDITDNEGHLIGLKGTYGCFRMADEDLIIMKGITDALESLIPSEHMTTLTFTQDESIRISNQEFDRAREDALLTNGTILLPEITVTAPKAIE